jgi:hypothetical protein
MRAAHCGWQMNICGNAMHSFTHPDSGNDPSKGGAGNKEVDTRLWEAMKVSFKKIPSEGR